MGEERPSVDSRLWLGLSAAFAGMVLVAFLFGMGYLVGRLLLR